MMKRTVFLMLYIFSLVCSYTYAQTGTSSVASDLKQLTQTLNKRRYTYRLSYTLYNSYRSLKPIENQVIDVKMWDMMINIRNKHFQIVKNKKNYLYVDPEQRTLMLNNVDHYSDEFKQFKEMENLLDMDTILSLYTKVDFLKSTGIIKGYRFHIRKGLEYAYSDVFFNTKTGYPEKIILYYARNIGALLGEDTDLDVDMTELPRLEMSFSNFVETPVLNNQYFSIQPFITERGKTFVPAAIYKDYTFINNTY